MAGLVEFTRGEQRGCHSEREHGHHLHGATYQHLTPVTPPRRTLPRQEQRALSQRFTTDLGQRPHKRTQFRGS